MKVSEDEKEALVNLFREMLDRGEECVVYEVLQVENFFPYRRAFRISVKALTEDI